MASAAERKRILVVDDAPDTLEVIQRNLTANGSEVFTAPGAAEATRVLDRERARDRILDAHCIGSD